MVSEYEVRKRHACRGADEPIAALLLISNVGKTMRVALGLKARTGRAILVAVSASPQVRVLKRSELRLLPEGAFAPYHAAEGLPAAAAQESVDRSVAAAHRLAEHGIRASVQALVAAGHEVSACAVLVGPGMPPW